MEIKEKSVASSKAGSLLETMSVLTLVFGVLAAIILFFSCFGKVYNGMYWEDNFNWATFSSAIEVFFGSLFVFAVGKTIARIANYAEAIYKNVNPDSELDIAFLNTTSFMMGDKVKLQGDNSGQIYTVSKIVTQDGYLRYECVNNSGEAKIFKVWEIFKVQQ